jgi:hypothetical protein
VVDGVADRGRLAPIAERAARAARAHDHQPGPAALARHDLRNSSAVTVRIAHVARSRAHVVHDRMLRGDLGNPKIRAGVDDGDRRL